MSTLREKPAKNEIRTNCSLPCGQDYILLHFRTRQIMKIYHNPSCSKSRGTLAILREREVETEVIEYLKTPPTAEELKRILTLLGKQPRELLRATEAKEAGIDGLDGDALVDAMVANPITIERPIVVTDGAAVIGRPPENVLDLIK